VSAAVDTCRCDGMRRMVRSPRSADTLGRARLGAPHGHASAPSAWVARLTYRVGGSAATAHAEVVIAGIASRLRRVSSHLSDADFAELVLCVARTSVRFEAIDRHLVRSASTGVPPSAEDQSKTKASLD
jgi:hypothetical protein